MAANLVTLSKLCQSLNDWLQAKKHAYAVVLILIYTVHKIMSAKANL